MAKKKLTFEEALKRLEEVVRELEDGQLSLEKSLELFSEGINLSKICRASLEEAEERIMVLTADGGLKEIGN
ncbi:MAG: exodeoxyribonuclease VII small subunit [Peptococcaceae bacterium]|nr:exodeoxyribonuclease VII small subunit [Peptococcaceae bacterium]